MGTPIVGREAIVGLRKSTAWGTALACGVNHGFLINSEGIAPDFEDLQSNPLGQAFENASIRGKESFPGSPLPGELQFEGFDTAIALFLGIAGAPTETPPASGAYMHTWDPKASIFGLMATMAALKKSDQVWEYPSMKIVSLTLKGSMRGLQTIEFGMIPNTLVRNGAGGVNNTTTILTVTYRAIDKLVYADENAYFRINDQAGAGLASGDALGISDYTLTLQRVMSGIHVFGSAGISEPLDTGMPTGRLELMRPDYDDKAAQFFTDLYATPRTPKKAELYLQGPAIGAGFYATKILMPHLEILAPKAPLTGPGRIPFSVTCAVRAATVAPTGMTGITKPLRWQQTNTVNVDALA